MCEEDYAQGVLCRRLQVHISNRYRLTELNFISDICLKPGASMDTCTNDTMVLNIVTERSLFLTNNSVYLHHR
jgi:hypothetical protein